MSLSVDTSVMELKQIQFDRALGPDFDPSESRRLLKTRARTLPTLKSLPLR